ncbi:MAG: hypothetical protein AAE985_03440 [Thermoplasmataceae archaeon]|jgi:hypothetical protein
MSVNGLKFEFINLRGSRYVQGPTLSFSLRARIDAREVGKTINKECTARYAVIGGTLSVVKPDKGESIVGNLFPEDFQFQDLDVGNEQSSSLYLQLSDSAMSELVEIGKNRMFRLSLNVIGNYFEGDWTRIRETALNGEFLNRNYCYVTDRTSGRPNEQYFQIPLEQWRDAVNSTRVGQYIIKEVVIKSIEKPHIKPLISIITSAESLLTEGKIEEALAKLRKIPEWAGYKKTGEENRYATLGNISFSDNERRSVKFLLDFLWHWTAKGHHAIPSGSEIVSYEQVKSALETSYFIISLFSRYDYLANNAGMNDDEDKEE